jgi:aspartyl-tRNA(Asn)/glutamyl-tRNA(Gln) amidotransferase subunit C
MALNIQDIKKVAHLARIEINEQDADKTLTKLTGILGLIEEMQNVDTTGIVPMSHSQDLNQRVREDAVTKANLRETFQKNAPILGNDSTEQAVAEGLYLVPKVIE